MNFQLVQEAIKHGWSTNETDFDNIDTDYELVHAIVSGNMKLSDDDIAELIDTRDDDEKSKLIHLLISENAISKNDFVKMYIEHYGSVSEAYCLIEKEYSVYNSDLRKLSDEDRKIYADHVEDDDKNYDEFKKAYDFTAFVKQKFADDKSIDHEDIIEYAQDLGKLTLEEVMSGPFIDSLNNINADRSSSLYRGTYDTRVELVGDIFEHFNYDEDLVKKYFDHVYNIDEDTFDNNLHSAYIRKEMKEVAKVDRQTNRISISEAEEYIRDNKFSVKITVSSGHIGLEDMTFDTLYIDGERQGDSFGSRSWISGRSFGDNSMSKDWFYEQVNAYKLSEDEEIDPAEEVDEICTECWDPDCEGCND